jgi:hypothetical protein
MSKSTFPLRRPNSVKDAAAEFACRDSITKGLGEISSPRAQGGAHQG